LRRHAHDQRIGLRAHDVGDGAGDRRADLQHQLLEAGVVVHRLVFDEDAPDVQRDAGRRHRVEVRLADRVGRGHEHTELDAVVKANGYGFGSLAMAEIFAAHGADALGLADLGDAIRLRTRGITLPILVYPNALPEMAREMIAHRLTPTLVDLDGARVFSDAVPASSAPYPVFVKVDVGLERLGVPADQAVKTIQAILELPRLR